MNKVWHCNLFHNPLQFCSQLNNYAAIALNHNLGKFFPQLWQSAKYRVAVDGGGNRIFDLNMSEIKDPHLIKGDLDSLRHEVREFYSKKGVIVEKDPNQDTTDLQKAFLSMAYSDMFQGFKDPIIICGGLGGNLTHTIANIASILHPPNLQNQIYLLSDDNVGIVLEKGEHTIIGHSNMYCGFIPLLGPTTINSSSNLKYPIDGLQLSFDSLLSTSNQFLLDTITVNVNEPILFLADARDS